MTDVGQAQSPIRVLIVEDHHVVALGLRALIEDDGDIVVTGVARSVSEAVALARTTDPEVVLMDYRLPDGTGADATKKLRASQSPPAVVMITSVADRHVLGEALAAGCTGFVSKNADRVDLITAIRAAADDDSYFTRDVLSHLIHLRKFDEVDDQELTIRECEVLQLVADGLNTAQVGESLGLSPHTVKNHVRHAMSKLDVHTKLEAVVAAIRLRLISIDG